MKIMFCGHRDVHDEHSVEEWLYSVIDNIISKGGTKFYLGGYGGFDSLAASVANRVKQHNPHIELILVLPYINKIANCAPYDYTIYPPLESVPPRYAIIHRNRWMVENTDMVIAYVTHGWGGASSTLQYAIKKKKHIILYPNHECRLLTTPSIPQSPLS